MKPKLKKQDYIGLEHSGVKLAYEGNPEFVNYMNIKDIYGNNFTGAVYHVAEPNLEKGHKEYLILRSHTDPVLMTTKLYVLGRDAVEMEEFRIHDGVLCKACNTILVSLNRHDYHGCGCENDTFVDGGRDYTRYGGKDIYQVEQIKIDLLTEELVE